MSVDTVWAHVKPGDVGAVVSEELDEMPGKHAVLYFGLDGPDPDWIRLPPELGDESLRVQDRFVRPCILCRSQNRPDHDARCFVVESSKHGPLVACGCRVQELWAWAKP